MGDLNSYNDNVVDDLIFNHGLNKQDSVSVILVAPIDSSDFLSFFDLVALPRPRDWLLVAPVLSQFGLGGVGSHILTDCVTSSSSGVFRASSRPLSDHGVRMYCRGWSVSCGSQIKNRLRRPDRMYSSISGKGIWRLSGYPDGWFLKRR